VSAGIILFAHGSRVESANEAVRAAAKGLACVGPCPLVEPAFLELGQPDLAGAALRLVQAGVHRIIVVPYFLTLGTHMERDLPALVQDIAKSFNDIEISVTPPLDGHPALVQILQDRAVDALG